MKGEKIIKYLNLWMFLCSAALFSVEYAKADETCPKQTAFSEPEYHYQYFSGTIDEKYPFTIILSNQKNGCIGTYSYDKHKQILGLRGVCDSQKIELYESYYNDPAKDNKFVVQINKDKMIGTWYDAKKKKSFPVSVTQFVPDKKTILTQAKGIYRLENIQASCCANALYDVYKEKGVWEETASAINQGMREGHVIKLSKKYKATLSTAMIKVDDALNIQLYANGKLLATFPYTEKSVFQLKSGTTCEAQSNLVFNAFKLKALKQGDNFYGESLQIALTDSFNLAPYFVEDILTTDREDEEPMPVLVEYQPLNAIFSIKFASTRGFDRAELTFARQLGNK